MRKSTSATSSGYCTTNSTNLAPTTNSSQQSGSIYMNLENYFYDENFSKIKFTAQENNAQAKNHIVKCLIDYELSFLTSLRHYIENYIRPLQINMESSLFYEIFQNIEKLYQLAEFLRNSIDEAMRLGCDLYNSTMNVVYDHLSMISNLYGLYINGYKAAQQEAQAFAPVFNQQLPQFVHFTDEICKIIDLPVLNLTKMLSAFTAIMDMTPLTDSHEYERLNRICHTLSKIIEDNQVFESSSFCNNFLNICSPPKQLKTSSRRVHRVRKNRMQHMTEQSSVKLYYL